MGYFQVLLAGVAAVLFYSTGHMVLLVIALGATIQQEGIFNDS